MKKKKEYKLVPDLIPSTSFFKNLRSMLSPDDWDFIRKTVYRRAGYRCEICNDQGPKHPVECHEKWDYDEDSKMQKLVGLIALCPMCHKVQHIGLAFTQGFHVEVVHHMMKVNNIKSKEAYDIINEAFNTHALRSSVQWGIDIDYINDFMSKNRKNPSYTLN